MATKVHNKMNTKTNDGDIEENVQIVAGLHEVSTLAESLISIYLFMWCMDLAKKLTSSVISLHMRTSIFIFWNRTGESEHQRI